MQLKYDDLRAAGVTNAQSTLQLLPQHRRIASLRHRAWFTGIRFDKYDKSLLSLRIRLFDWKSNVAGFINVFQTCSLTPWATGSSCSIRSAVTGYPLLWSLWPGQRGVALGGYRGVSNRSLLLVSEITVTLYWLMAFQSLLDEQRFESIAHIRSRSWND